VNSREELAARGELALDVAALRRAGGDDLLLRGVRVLELRLVALDLCLEHVHLVRDLRILVRDAVDGVDAAEEIVEARCAEDDVQRRGGARRGIDRDEPIGKRALRVPVVRAGDG
jgi:hypothetical protein